ncbi:heme oxygenase-like protein [Hypoxylon trugodes]|uniref:heme oxygenase-like protein n=1 Tax=Hypoxylon trugodes TaxID=326681 RepID=UPI0021957E4E|nr:heme oxygenase-like protein [Hypoxylon trugodes]KAI1391526.1 heme oxygenase-like protein [Hypoxylon trugodes]
MPSKTEDGAATTPPTTNRTLGESINIATRPAHTKLNKLIILRLPLALPPRTDDASNYVQGLLHIAPIYATFEGLWQGIIQDPLTSTKLTTDSNSTVFPRIHALLKHIYLPNLARSSALHEDLTALTGWSDATLAERLAEVSSESPILAELLSHIRDAVGEKPHVLIAYAWVLYMALFSGGRFIRASLERVGKDEAFWRPMVDGGESDSDNGEQEEGVIDEYKMPGGYPSTGTGARWEKTQRKIQNQRDETATEHPLSFFRFATPSDGEDLKVEFKARLATSTCIPADNTAATLQTDLHPNITTDSRLFLTKIEQEDVVSEAQNIFSYMTNIVGELDEVCGTEYEAATVA